MKRFLHLHDGSNARLLVDLDKIITIIDISDDEGKVPGVNTILRLDNGHYVNIAEDLDDIIHLMRMYNTDAE